MPISKHISRHVPVSGSGFAGTGAKLSFRTAKQLKELVENPKTETPSIQTPQPKPFIQRSYACKVTTQITAFASGGPTPGTGKVTLYRIDDDTGDLVEVDTGIDVYNMVNATVAVNSWGNCSTDNWGKLWFIVEDC